MHMDTKVTKKLHKVVFTGEKLGIFLGSSEFASSGHVIENENRWILCLTEDFHKSQKTKHST